MVSRPRNVIPANAALAAELGARLSPEHVREVLDTSGVDAKYALSASLAASVEAYAYVPRGRALFMMGVERASPMTGSALLWMLGAQDMRQRPAAVLRAARWGLERAFSVTGAERLEQFIPRWYGAGLRFVLRLGFVVRLTPLLSRRGEFLCHAVKGRECGDGGERFL